MHQEDVTWAGARHEVRGHLGSIPQPVLHLRRAPVHLEHSHWDGQISTGRAAVLIEGAAPIASKPATALGPFLRIPARAGIPLDWRPLVYPNW